MRKVKSLKTVMVIAIVAMLLMIMQSSVLATSNTIVITGNTTTNGIQSIPTVNSVNTNNTQNTNSSITTIPTTNSVTTIPTTETNKASKVTVTITANKEVQALGNGWTLSTDKKTLTKTFSANTTETVTLTDTAGNKGDVMEVKVDMALTNGGTNVDYTLGNSNTTKPLASIKYAKTAGDDLPQTGLDYTALIIMAVCVISGVYAYVRIREYNQIQY